MLLLLICEDLSSIVNRSKGISGGMLTAIISIGFYYIALAMVTTIFCICALRTNVVLFSALFTLIFAFGCAAGGFWNFAQGNVVTGEKLTVVSLPFSFLLSFSRWTWPRRSFETLFLPISTSPHTYLTLSLGRGSFHFRPHYDGVVFASRSTS